MSAGGFNLIDYCIYAGQFCFLLVAAYTRGNFSFIKLVAAYMKGNFSFNLKIKQAKYSHLLSNAIKPPADYKLQAALH